MTQNWQAHASTLYLAFRGHHTKNVTKRKQKIEELGGSLPLPVPSDLPRLACVADNLKVLFFSL